MDIWAAAANLWGKARGGVADLRRMPRARVAELGSGTVLYRYHPVPAVTPAGGAPVLLVPPLGAPDFAYDLRRGCSMVQHLVGSGRTVYLADYGRMSFADRRLGMEHWVDDVVPWAVAETARREGELHLLGWSIGGIFCLLAVAAARDRGEPLPVATMAVIGSPVDISAIPLIALPRCARSALRGGRCDIDSLASSLIAPLRPLAAITGGRGLSAVYQAIGSFPAPLVSAAFQLTAVDKLVSKPLTILSRLDDRECLAQIEAVDHLMNNMHGYPGRVFGQLYHLLLRNNDLADGTLALGGRAIPLDAVDVPVLVVAGRTDVIAPLAAVRKLTELLTGAPEVRFETAPGGHLGVLTGREARSTTWTYVDKFLVDHS